MAEIRTNQAQALAALLENKTAKEATEAADVGERLTLLHKRLFQVILLRLSLTKGSLKAHHLRLNTLRCKTSLKGAEVRFGKTMQDIKPIRPKQHLEVLNPDELSSIQSATLQLLESVDSPYLGLNFDTGNFLRLLDDPIEGARKLAPHVLATHVKDLKPQKGVSPAEWYFFSSTPVGEGLVDNMELARILKAADFQGFMAVEIDFLHPDYPDEDAAVEQSVKELKRIAASL